MTIIENTLHFCQENSPGRNLSKKDFCFFCSPFSLSKVCPWVEWPLLPLPWGIPFNNSSKRFWQVLEFRTNATSEAGTDSGYLWIFNNSISSGMDSDVLILAIFLNNSLSKGFRQVKSDFLLPESQTFSWKSLKKYWNFLPAKSYEA